MATTLLHKFQALKGLLVLSLLSLFIQWAVFDFILPSKLILPWLLYASFLFILKPYYAVGFVFLLESLFLRIHLMKMSHTNTALEISDILGWRQALFLKGYSDLLVPLLLFAILYCFFRGINFKKKQFLFLPVMLLVSTSCVQERHPTEKKLNPVSFLFGIANVQYVDWNFATNIKENGILNHLFLTLPMGQIPRKGEVLFESDQISSMSKSPVPIDVFLILCESCYTSMSNKFITPMAQLMEHGFVHTSLISPVYGGMTAEAEFEVLTGLPSQRYKGIDFQYFADSFAAKADGLPRVLGNAGYDTFSSHNNDGFFWRRDVIHPKFGFANSYFLEDMNWSDRNNKPPDSVMFEASLKAYENRVDRNKKTFAFLITLSTHGPYKDLGDGGEADYKEKLSQAIADFLRFQDRVSEISHKKGRRVLFLIFGDHKPAMTISFYKHHVFDDGFFSSVKNGALSFSDLSSNQRLTYGRVPLFVKSDVSESMDIAKSIASELRDKPIYCLPGVLAGNIGIKNQYYQHLRSVCRRPSEKLVDPYYIKSVFPEEIYGNLLFK